MRSISAGLLALSTALFLVAATSRGADYEPGTPSAYLFDTGSLAREPLGAAQLTSKSGWKVVPEDNVTHKFRGDTVLLNDRLVLVLRGKADRLVVVSKRSFQIPFRLVGIAPIVVEDCPSWG